MKISRKPLYWHVVLRLSFGHWLGNGGGHLNPFGLCKAGASTRKVNWQQTVPSDREAAAAAVEDWWCLPSPYELCVCVCMSACSTESQISHSIQDSRIYGRATSESSLTFSPSFKHDACTTVDQSEQMASSGVCTAFGDKGGLLLRLLILAAVSSVLMMVIDALDNEQQPPLKRADGLRFCGAPGLLQLSQALVAANNVQDEDELQEVANSHAKAAVLRHIPREQSLSRIDSLRLVIIASQLSRELGTPVRPADIREARHPESGHP
eukprot:4225418-Amphidinium_carterae.1